MWGSGVNTRVASADSWTVPGHETLDVNSRIRAPTTSEASNGLIITMKNKYLIQVALSTVLLIGAWVVRPEADTESSTAHQARHGAPQVTRTGEMSTDRAAHQATRLSSGDVLITGGCGGNRPGFHQSQRLYFYGQIRYLSNFRVRLSTNNFN